MSAEHYVEAVDWNRFVKMYQSEDDDLELDEVIEECEIDIESLEFDYDIGRCLAEEFSELRSQLSKDQLYYFHHFLYLLFPHYMEDEPISDERFDLDSISVFDLDPNEEHSENVLCMLNPESVKIANDLFGSIDMESLATTAEQTWGGSDCFDSAQDFVSFMEELGNHVKKIHSKNGGLVGMVL